MKFLLAPIVLILMSCTNGKDGNGVEKSQKKIIHLERSVNADSLRDGKFIFDDTINSIKVVSFWKKGVQNKNQVQLFNDKHKELFFPAVTVVGKRQLAIKEDETYKVEFHVGNYKVSNVYFPCKVEDQGYSLIGANPFYEEETCSKIEVKNNIAKFSFRVSKKSSFKLSGIGEIEIGSGVYYYQPFILEIVVR